MSDNSTSNQVESITGGGDQDELYYTIIPNCMILAGVLQSMEARLIWQYLYSKNNMRKKWSVCKADIQKQLGFKERGWDRGSAELVKHKFLILKNTQKGKQYQFVSQFKDLICISTKKLSPKSVDNSVDK